MLTNNENELRYYNDIKNKEMLTPEEERELLKKIKEEPNNKVYIKRLIEANLRFVIKIAQKYTNSGLDINELINEGNLGLIKAARKFDYTQNVRFISYAVWWIRQSIQKAIYEQANLIRIPSNKYNLFKKFKEKLYENNNDIEATLELEEFKPYRKELIELYKTSTSASLENTLSTNKDDSDELTFEDIIYEDPIQEEMQFNNEVFEYFNKIINEILTEKEAKIIRMYYGIGYDREYTLEELGEELKLTKERIRQIKKKALKKLYSHPKAREFLGIK